MKELIQTIFIYWYTPIQSRSWSNARAYVRQYLNGSV